jgi:hypothetical protein
VQPPAGLPAAQGDPLGSSVTLSPRAPGATLNNTGPEIFPPNYRPIRPGASVGPFTGGYSTENMGGDDANWRDPVWKASEHMTEGPTGGSNFDPRNWFKPGPAFKPGEPIGGAGGGGGFFPSVPLPWWARGALIGASGAIGATPAETGEFTPAEPNFVRPDAPMGGVHGLPAAPKPADDGGGKPPVEPNKAHPRAKTPAPGKRAPIPAGDINLGYYSPTTGNARGATFQKYTDPNDPRIYKGPLTMYGQQ